MKEQQTERQDATPTEKKTNCVVKLVKGILYFVLTVVAIWGIWFLAVDRDATPVPIVDVYDEVDASKGEVPDYCALYNTLQEKDALPAEENGWVDVYKALGPKSIEQMYTAERTKWEEFETNQETGSADVYEKWHKPLCEKFGLDPKEKPTFYDRLELIPYLVKNGIQGNETVPEESSKDNDNVNNSYSYWENAEERDGVIPVFKANDEFIRLISTVWTAEESPNVAKWLEENSDRFDLIAQAVRRPKFHSWHYTPSPDEGTMISMLLPDVQYARELAREFSIRANLRVGTGDLSGAIDDIETIVRMSRHMLDSESGCLVERLVGLACLGIAANIPIDGNVERQPNAEERARFIALWRECIGDDTIDSRIDAIQRGEFLLCSAAFADFLELADKGDAKTLNNTTCLIGNLENYDYPIASKLLRLVPINKPKACQLFRKNWMELTDTPTVEEREKRIDELHRSCQFSRFYLSTESIATAGISLLFPAMDAMTNAIERCDCLMKQLVVAQAVWAYYDANGTFPPTFSVDANGAPLHSWRTLILPYLGEEEKALYEQIKLDEPWNSDHNKTFAAKMPEIYRCVSAEDAKEGETVYSLLVSKDGVFDRSGIGKDPKPFFQQTDREFRSQVMLAENATPVCWMAPDAEIDLDLAVASLDVSESERVKNARERFGVKLHSGGFNIISFNGGARFLSELQLIIESDARHFLQGIPKPQDADEEVEPADESDANAIEEAPANAAATNGETE